MTDFVRIPIKDRDQWLGLRRADCTASTIGCLLGVHPYISPYGLYCLKAGLVPEDPEETAAMRRGRLLEPVAVQLLREDHPEWSIDQPGAYYRDVTARLGATPDATVKNGRGFGVVQIKTVEPNVFRRTWREEGEITPPLWIACQALVEAYLTGADWAAVAAMVVGFGIDLHVIDIPIQRKLVDRIKAEVAAFWVRIEERNPYPPDYGRDGALIAKLYANVEKGKELDLRSDNELPALVAERVQKGDEIEALKARRDAIRAEILEKMGDAEAAFFAGGRITAKMVSKKPYQVMPKPYRDLRVKLTENAA